MTENTCTTIEKERKLVISQVCDNKTNSFIKVMKLERIIYIYTYPLKSYTLKFNEGNPRDICALTVKKIIANGLHIGQSHVHFFALCSGPLTNPIKMFCDNDILPENISHFSFLRLSFFLNREEQYLQRDKHAELLIFNEMITEFLNKTVLPIPDFVTHSKLIEMRASNDITGFWSTLSKHSRCIPISGIAFWYLDNSFGTKSVHVPIRIAVDISGIHFFDVGGTSVVMSWYWTTVGSLKIQTRPEMILKFSVVIKENMKFFLRDICVHTSSCEFILSTAEVILRAHGKWLKSNPNQRSIELDTRQFSCKESQSKLYQLVRQPEMDNFCKYSDSLESDEVNLFNSAYCQPLGFYIANANHEPLPDESNILSLKIYYSSRKSFIESKANSSPYYFKDFVIIRMIVSPQSSIPSRELLLEVSKYLHLRRESLEFFSLYQMKNGRLVRFLGNHDPTNVEIKLVLKSTILFWSKEQDLKQWEMITEDEKAIQLIFWEVMSAHAGVIQNVDLILSYFTYTCNLLEVVFTLGAIADMHSADDCILVWKLTNIPNDGYSPGKRVLLSLDSDGLHFWEPVRGTAVVSWGWPEVSGMHRDEQQETLTFRIFVAAGQSRDYRNVTIKTSSTSYLYLLSQLYMATSQHQLECNKKLPSSAETDHSQPTQDGDAESLLTSDKDCVNVGTHQKTFISAKDMQCDQVQIKDEYSHRNISYSLGSYQDGPKDMNKKASGGKLEAVGKGEHKHQTRVRGVYSCGVYSVGKDNLVNVNPTCGTARFARVSAKCRGTISYYPIVSDQHPLAYMDDAIALLSQASPTGDGRFFFSCFSHIIN